MLEKSSGTEPPEKKNNKKGAEKQDLEQKTLSSAT